MKSLLTRAFSDKLAALLHILGWPVLLALVYYWLEIPEQKTAQLGLSAVLALLLLFLLSFLLALAFTPGAPRLKSALRRAPHMAVLVLVWGAAIFAALHYLHKDWQQMLAASGLLLLFAPLCAAGFTGYRQLGRVEAWIAMAAFLLLGLYLPWKLIWWIPKLETFSAQAASAFLRFSAAGLLFAALWLVLGSALSRPEPEHDL